MNFLSHYYFDLSSGPYEIMGTVLPDLIKNAVKSANLYPQKHELEFQHNAQHLALLKGWKRHLAVDKYFHASDFFLTETAQLKTIIKPVTADTEIRPSFLAHIALELVLDHLLLKKNLLKAEHFYTALELVDKATLDQFLVISGLSDPTLVSDFNSRFISSRYLLSYQKQENISYALNRICMRLWPETLPEHKISELNNLLEPYSAELEGNFIRIFNEIESVLEH